MKRVHTKPKKLEKPETIDQYLAGLPPDKRAALARLRKDIHAAAKGIEECISYAMPGFRLDGRMLVWFGAASKHCAFYPGGLVGEYARELAAYDTSKGTIRFSPEQPLPAALVRKLVKARIAANSERPARRAARVTGG